MSKKCVHKSCGKTYDSEDEECIYHPGPPVFHEGQKGANPGRRHHPTPKANVPLQAGNAANPAF